MIQRPQSVCLLVIIFSLLAIHWLPIWAKTGEEASYVLYAWSLQNRAPGLHSTTSTYVPYALIGLLALLVVGIAVYGLFRYDNRPLQLKLGTLNSLAMVVLLAAIFYLTRQNESQTLSGTIESYSPSFYLLPISLASNLLANYFIRKDEALVRAADRMR
jgi:hypothetical protein